MNIARGTRWGIGSRLGLAFALSALLAVTASLVGWAAYERLSQTIRQLAEDDVPAMVSAGRLMRLGSQVSVLAQRVSQAGTNEEAERAADAMDQHLVAMQRIAGDNRLGDAHLLREIVAQIGRNNGVILTETLAGLALRRRSDGLLRELRALHGDLAEEAEPLIDDARFTGQFQLEEIEGQRLDSNTVPEIRRQARKMEAILQLSSQANLAIGLLLRIAAVETREQWNADQHFLAETLDQLHNLLGQLTDASDLITLRQIVQRLVELTDAGTGLPGLRGGFLEHRARTDILLADNRHRLALMDREIASIVAQVSGHAAASSAATADSIRLGRQVLALISGLAVAAALAIGVLYVRSNLLRRIRVLAQAARALADGRTVPPVPIDGGDELTHMAQALERFRLTRDEMIQSAKLAALGTMSAGIAHEVSQPLHAVRAHVHNALVLQERGDAEGLRRSLGKIEALTEKTTEVVAHLRRFARRSDVALGPVPVFAAVNDAIALLSPRIQVVDAEIQIAIPEPLNVLAERIQFEQVMINLVSNALDAVEGRPDGFIRIEGEKTGGKVKISVRDSGPGIPAHLADRIFDPFFTTKSGEKGVGLGLSISSMILSDFGGALRALASFSGGCFVIELDEAAGGVAT